jgi:hypothetical protein
VASAIQRNLSALEPDQTMTIDAQAFDDVPAIDQQWLDIAIENDRIRR